MKSARQWQRFMLAGFAAAFLVLGVGVSAFDILPVGSQEFVSGTLLKVGFVLALGWIAAPQLQRLGWEKLQGSLLVALIIVLILLVIRPRIGAIAAAILVGGTLFVTLVGWFRSFVGPKK